MRYEKNHNLIELRKIGKMWVVHQENPMNIGQWGYKRKGNALKQYNTRVNDLKRELRRRGLL